MDANERKEYAAKRLQDVRTGILENAGKGDAAIANILPPEVQAYRQLLKMRLAAERGRTYTYKDPNNIPTGEIKITMPHNDAIIARPPGWSDRRMTKKEKKAAKKAAKVGSGFQGASQATGSTGTSGYSGGGGGIGGASAGGSGLAGTSGGTRITGSGSMQPITPTGQYYADQQLLRGSGSTTSGGGWLGKLIATLLKDD